MDIALTQMWRLSTGPGRHANVESIKGNLTTSPGRPAHSGGRSPVRLCAGYYVAVSVDLPVSVVRACLRGEDEERRAVGARREFPAQDLLTRDALEERRRSVARHSSGGLDQPASGKRERQHDAALGGLGVSYELRPQLLRRAGK